jgi:hypothetical protein
MKIVIAIVLAALVVQGGFATDTQAAISRKWVPAVYRGLIVGKSTRGDVLRVLGKPKYIDKEEETGIPRSNYEVSDPVSGILVVSIERGIVQGMELYPNKQYSNSEIVRVFGSHYLAVRYDFDDCLSGGGSAPIYENPNGLIEHVEYRNRGIAIAFHNGVVESILFVARPFGPTRSRCTGNKRKKQGKD